MSTNTFLAGRISNYIDNWQQLTSDEFILDMVRGAKIPIEDHDQIKHLYSKKNQIKQHEIEILDKEVEKLLKMGVIERSVHEPNEVISPVFLRQKSDGSHRMILNLKQFNESVEYQHFKMENLQSATMLMKKGCFMASVDLKHAYYSVPIHHVDRKYLKFKHRGQLYSYTCFPNGLCFCPRWFTKLLKPVYSNLRSLGYLSASFIDDFYLQGDTAEECRENVDATVQLFQSLGFFVHDTKSVLRPCKELKYLGFLLNSDEMTVSLPPEKIDKGIRACSDLVRKRKFTIRELSQVIGLIVSFFPGVLWGPLYYRNLESLKTSALKSSRGEFESLTTLTADAELELSWWIDNLGNVSFPLERNKPEFTIQTDASSNAASTGGWGAVLIDMKGKNKVKTGGRWNQTENQNHINYLELLAIFFALKSFQTKISGKHVKVMCDNTTAISYIQNFGGSKVKSLNDLAKKIWVWCKERDIWITISFLAGILNSDADFKSRNFKDNTEWKLDENIFRSMLKKLETPCVDLFASRLNHQLDCYVAWEPDPDAFAIDAFTLDWCTWSLCYIFAPFSVIQRCLWKLSKDQADAVMIVPYWPTAVWWPQLMNILTDNPILLPKGKRVIYLPHTQDPHPLYRKLQLLAVTVSGKSIKSEGFRTKCPKFCQNRSGNPPKPNICLTSDNGKSSVFKGRLIPFVQL